ncbi:MAG: PucR family transcriptional regulator [Mycobacteriales bacterium]
MSTAPTLMATLRRIERASGALATQSVARMDELLPWFRALPPDQRSWITLVAQAGVAEFVQWLRQPSDPTSAIGIFGTAPPELARAVSLQQTVELVRVTVDVVESRVGTLAAPGEEAELRDAVLRYSREVAFAAAQVYAGVAESRGAWDARMEALVVDALLRGEPDDALPGRAATLGWAATTDVAVTIGSAPGGDPEAVLDAVHRAARGAGVAVLAGVHGDRLVVVAGRLTGADVRDALRPLIPEFGRGPVVIGGTAPDLAGAARSARVALSGLRAAAGWPAAPRPALAEELLPERALGGDDDARTELIRDVVGPLMAAGGPLLDTVSAYFDAGRSLEATARALFVHPNTVRYRLRRVADLTGHSPTRGRDAFTLQVGMVLARLAAAVGPRAL